MRLETLRKRNEFLRVRGGGRCSTHAFILEGKQRNQRVGDRGELRVGPRFGFTVTKRLGNAVRRNRIRRRLRAALQQVAMQAARDQVDYVVVARAAAYDMPFSDLKGLMLKAFERVHQPNSGLGRRQSNRGRRQSKRPEDEPDRSNPGTNERNRCK